MITKIVTSAALTPVTAAEIETYSIITAGQDTALLTRLIEAATAAVEDYLCRKLITQTWKMFLDRWPQDGIIKVFFGDLQSVTHVKYTDVDESTETFSTDYYLVDANSVPGRILLGYGDSWPSDTLSARYPIEIQFVTGYGAATTNVPQDIRHAIMLMVGEMYDNRTPEAKISTAVESLLYKHRIWDWVL